MATELYSAPAPPRVAARAEVQARPLTALSTLTDLAADIGTDAKTLVEQHGTLLKAELTETRNKATVAVALVGGAVGAIAIGGLFLMIGLVHLTVYLFPNLPEFAAWLIWGGVLATAAVIAALIGVRTLTNLDILPRRTLRSLKESWSCLLTRQK